jgi:hypothetical protein
MSNEYAVVGTFPILWTNWECNPVGYILKDKKGKITFSYDTLGKDRISVKSMQDKIIEYKNAIRETKKALEYLTTGST